MKNYYLLLFLLISNFIFSQENEKKNIEITLKNYLEGTSYSQPEQIKKAFFKDANLYLDKKDQDVWIVPITKYASWFENEKQGEFNGRIGTILQIDINNNIATAKAEILFTKNNARYIDLFLIKKIDGNWKIISKTASSINSNQHGNRILFIVSNAHFYGDSELPTGNSYSEIVNAYDTFYQAGYSIDFVSPNGGSIPLAYINTSDTLQKKYLYQPDFMYALKNTKAPQEVNPKNYKAVHYIGGGSALFGVPENKSIHKIVMQIYEEQDGIISSVCHGTAGIVHLKTNNGEYLVNSKTINGYPDAFERKDAEYFKEFPFLITKTIEERGGTFVYSPRNKVHVEVDGHIVTGQNYLSSKYVALKIIKMLEQK